MIPSQLCRYVAVEALEQFFTGAQFEIFLSELAYALDVEELGGHELGRVGLLITKARFLALAEDLGVLDSTIALLEENLAADQMIDLVPVDVLAHETA